MHTNEHDYNSRFSSRFALWRGHYNSLLSFLKLFPFSAKSWNMMRILPFIRLKMTINFFQREKIKRIWFEFYPVYVPLYKEYKVQPLIISRKIGNTQETI